MRAYLAARKHKRTKTKRGTSKANSRYSPRDNIGLGLAVLSVLNHRGSSLSLMEIADICGCSFQNIYNIERKALGKVRAALEELGINLTEFERK